LPGAIIGGAHASVSLSAARSGLDLQTGFRLSALGFRQIPNAERRTPNDSSRAFTLTELLIVIALIVLLLAMAVPAFNFISGGRSIDGAQNVVSAMLGRARARAIETERYAGVAFYLDPATGRSTMTMIIQRDGAISAEDPFDIY
jgi:prepilin-type N-terminal cleavage/methylation domain-containing protein